MSTIVLDDIGQLQTVYDSINKDFNDIDYGDWLNGQLDQIADLEKSYFDSSTGPDGQPWKPNAPSTIKQKGHATVLRGVRSRKAENIKATSRRAAVNFRRSRWIGGYRLATSLTAKSHQSYGDAIREAIATDQGGVLSFGTSVEYAGYNQFGTTRIPARPHVGLTEPFVDKATNSVADYTVKKLIK